MKFPLKYSEAGQAFVLLALAFVGMIGFAGLAIDGGIVFTDRRHAQNAADAAALAGALAKLDNLNLYTAAFARANDNSFDNSGVKNWVYVYNPPIDGPYTGEDQYVQVRIVSQVDTVFAHFVFGGELENTVTAVARAKPATTYPFASGDALVGLAETGCSVVWSHGSADAFVSGAGIHVNSNDPNCAFRADGNNKLKVNGGDIKVVGGADIGSNATVNPSPITGVNPMDPPTIDPPTCSANAVRNNGAGTFTPGYTDDFKFTGGNWTLAPGIYCVDNGFEIGAGTNVTGVDVMIYVMSGDVTWNGAATINLDAPDDGEFAGLLIYQAVGNTQRATINGDSSSTFYGTMFFPSAEVQINGTGASNGFHSQVVADKVDMSGTSDLEIIYDPAENYQVREAPKVDLTE